MKELKSTDDKPIITTHYPINQRLPTKRWIIAQARPEKQQVIQNECTEAAYHRVIDAVKKLYLKSGDTYYERDSKQDRTTGFLSMHSFMCATFYCVLYCEFQYKYVVEYAFDNCQFEAEARALLKPFPLDRYATERDLKPDFKTFYRIVLTMLEPRFIHHI